jgi:hypothetical protein
MVAVKEYDDAKELDIMLNQMRDMIIDCNTYTNMQD